VVDVVSLVYVVVAVAGLLYYQWQSWKASGEAFDLSKFIDTAWSGGVIAVASSALGLSRAGLDFSSAAGLLTSLGSLSAAFALAGGVDTLQNKVLKSTKPKVAAE
jgi:steroid 5-alpha reductase family enzyme